MKSILLTEDAPTVSVFSNGHWISIPERRHENLTAPIYASDEDWKTIKSLLEINDRVNCDD